MLLVALYHTQSRMRLSVRGKTFHTGYELQEPTQVVVSFEVGAGML
jgi:hypothetical protein